ncbi:MAG TPA: hypothetical protein VEC11_02450 [Allosphingosinicella sp.]|nr:hypothetical protein [Allosphingosinicella sp.]
MRIKPNRTVVEATVERIARDPGGFGCNVEILVAKSKAAQGFEDFLQAKPGSKLTLFAPDPTGIKTGKSYALTASVLGGPSGERVVLEKAEAKGG